MTLSYLYTSYNQWYDNGNSTEKLSKNKVSLSLNKTNKRLIPRLMSINRKINFVTVIAVTKIYHIFALNNTSHASHLNSAPGLVFDFYRVNLNLVIL